MQFHTHLRMIRSLLDPYPRYPRDTGSHSRRMTRDGDVEGSLPGLASSGRCSGENCFLFSHALSSLICACACVYPFFSHKRRNAKSRILLRKSSNDDDDDEIAQDRRDRSGESGVEVNVSRTTTAVASSTKVGSSPRRASSPRLPSRSAVYFHERVGRQKAKRSKNERLERQRCRRHRIIGCVFRLEGIVNFNP